MLWTNSRKYILFAALIIPTTILSYRYLYKTNPQPTTNNNFPECRYGICPTYFSMDVDGDQLSESVVIQPTAMTQGAGKVLVIKNGNKIFESEELPGIWIKPAKTNNGFIITHSKKYNDDKETTKQEQYFKFENGTFSESNLN